MIHLINYIPEGQRVVLYNTEVDEIKETTLLAMGMMMDRGMKLDNDEKATELLQGKKFHKFIRKILTREEVEIADISTPNEVEVVSRLNLDATDIVNAKSYKFLISKLGICELDYSHYINSAERGSTFLIDYVVHSGTSYEVAKKEFFTPNEVIEQAMMDVSMFGDTFEYQHKDGLEPLIGWVPSEMTANEEQLYIPEGVSVAHLVVEGTSRWEEVYLPSTMISFDIFLKESVSLKLLDMSKASIKELQFTHRFSDGLTIREVRLPKRLERIKSIDFGSRFYGSRGVTPESLIVEEAGSRGVIEYYTPNIEVLYIPKSVKVIERSTVLARVIVFEKGIELESLDSSALVARHFVMSDDPRLGEFLSGDKRDTISEVYLDLGKSMKVFSNASLMTAGTKTGNDIIKRDKVRLTTKDWDPETLQMVRYIPYSVNNVTVSHFIKYNENY